MSNEIEIGQGKRGRRAYSFDDVAVVPSRRTRDPEEVSVAWQIDAYHMDLPILAAPMDSVMSPATAVQLGRFGGIGVLDLEGLWTRYADPEPLLAEIAELPAGRATERMQQIYSAPIDSDLVTERLREIRAGGVTVAGALSPQRTQEFWKRGRGRRASTCSSSAAPRSRPSTCPGGSSRSTSSGSSTSSTCR